MTFVGILLERVNVLRFKPILHWKLPLCWLPNANEINTKNMKCTWPTSVPCVGDPMPPIFHLLALGVGIGGNFSMCIGGNAKFSVFRYQLVSPTQNCCVGGVSQRKESTRMVLHRSGIIYDIQFNSKVNRKLQQYLPKYSY